MAGAGWHVLGAKDAEGLDPLTRLALGDTKAPVGFAPVDGQEALGGLLSDAARDAGAPLPSVEAVLADLDQFSYASVPPTVTWRADGRIVAAATPVGGLGQFFAPQAAALPFEVPPVPEGAGDLLIEGVVKPVLGGLAFAAFKRLARSLRRRWTAPLVLTSLGTLQAAPPRPGSTPLDPEAFDLTLITGWSRQDARDALRASPLPVRRVVTEGAAFESPVVGGAVGEPDRLFHPDDLEDAKRGYYAFLENTALAAEPGTRPAFVFRSQPNEAGVAVYVNLHEDEALRMESGLASPRRRLDGAPALAAALRWNEIPGEVVGTAVAVADGPRTAYAVEKTMARRHSYWPYVLWREAGRLHVSVDTPPPAPAPAAAGDRRLDTLRAACRRAEDSGAARSEHLVVQKDACVDVFVRPKHHYRQDVARQAGTDGTRKVVYVSRGTASDGPLIWELGRALGRRFDAFAVRDLPAALGGLGIHAARRDDDVPSLLASIGGRFSMLRRGLGRLRG